MLRPIAHGVVLLGVLAAAAPVDASVTIGSSLRQRANLYVRCAAQCTELQTARPGGVGVKVAADGVIVRWRLRSATLGAVRLRVLRVQADGSFQTDGAGVPQTLTRRHQPGEDVLYTFPERISVHAGDQIALDHDRRAGGIFHSYGQDTSYAAATFSPRPADTKLSRPDAPAAGRELLISADIERDEDSDGFGDETQDNCPKAANDQSSNPCLTAGTGAPDQPGQPEQPGAQTIGAAPPVAAGGSEGPPVSGEPGANRTTRDHSGQLVARRAPVVVTQGSSDHQPAPQPRRAPRRARRIDSAHGDSPHQRTPPARLRKRSVDHSSRPVARRAPRRGGTPKHGHRVRRAPRATPIQQGAPSRRHRSRPRSRRAPARLRPPGFRAHRPRS